MRILITGASRGIGRALAEKYLKEGHQIVALARNREKLEELRQKWGEKVEIYPVDLSNLDEVTEIGREIGGKGKEIDIAIFNAGISLPHAPDFTPPSQFEKLFNINFLSVHRLLAEILDLIPPNGKIVLISSLASIIASPTSLPYSASKRALNSYGESLYYLLEDKKVITILPGFIKTDMTAGHTFKMPFLMELEEAVERIVSSIGRGTPFYPFPRRFYYLLKLLSLLPFPVKKRIFKKIINSQISQQEVKNGRDN
ncbi:MAG: short-chain dehydrogenase [Epsilonproteobacteria bacterium]|nr:short-chain dehydrogenase [Campylobacterota bacterium]NPA89311.1 SDR family NAD(P)-dependent oxidoreductase [Campylobacterota bacterium]